MQSFARWLILCAMLWQAGHLWAATEQEKRLEDSTRVLQAILDTPDNGIPKDLLERSECVGIIPA